MVNLLEEHLESFKLFVYDNRELVSWEVLADCFLGLKFHCLLLGLWLGSVDGINIYPNEVIGIVKALWDIYGIPLGKYDVIELE